MSYLYCLQCGHMDEVYDGTHRKIVIHDEGENYYRLEWQECAGPFAFTEPIPFPLEDGWQDSIVIDPAELAVMNENAESFLIDLQ